MTPFDALPSKEPHKENDAVTIMLAGNSFEWTGQWRVNFTIDGEFYRKAIAGDPIAVRACEELLWKNFLFMRQSAIPKGRIK